jgi:hypothetical protein
MALVLSHVYHADSTCGHGPEVSLDWISENVGKVFCAHCRAVHRRLYPAAIDVVFRQTPTPGWTTGLGFRVGVPIYRVEFLEALGHHAQGFAIGRCLLPHGKVLTEYATAYAKDYVLMRGDERTTTKVCPLCGSVWTDLVVVYPKRPAYLLRRQLSDALVYQGRSGAFFLAEAVVSEIDWTHFPDMRVQRIDVLDRPLDGRRLPGDPDWDRIP